MLKLFTTQEKISFEETGEPNIGGDIEEIDTEIDGQIIAHHDGVPILQHEVPVHGMCEFLPKAIKKAIKNT